MPFSPLDRVAFIYYDQKNIMPELPQVENVRRFLAQVLLAPKPKKVKSVRVHYPGIIKSIDAGTFATRLTGQTFIGVSRYGKHLLIQFQDWTVISHLRMEGKYTLWGKHFIPQKHDHIQFLLSNGESLVYNDTRKFGTMHLVPKGTQYDHPSITKLGPEVNNSDTFTPEYLEKVCRKSTKMIKEVLLDQTKICGIGNIYADEILFAAHVRPDRRCRQMGQAEIAEMVERGREIIDAAIENKGTTFRSFSVNHSAGQFQSQLAVYGRGGQECTRCHGAITKVQLAGRGTHFCPDCQL